MKLRALIIITFIFSLCHAYGQVEEVRVNETFRRIPLSKALKTIQTKYEVAFAYDHKLIENVIVDLILKDVSVPDAIDRLLKGTSLRFQQIGKTIMILPVEVDTISPEKSDFRISGQAFDAETNETLPNAVIRIRGTNLATTTNDDGHFTILRIPTDTFYIDVSYMGFITQSMRLKTIAEPERIEIRLKSDTQILDEVVLVDEYNQAMQVQESPGAFAFNPRSLSSLPSLGEQDLSRTMQLLPGVSATDESSSGMVIRGTHSSGNLVMLDGMTIYQQDHFFGAISIINADIVKDVRVQKGMFDAKYGGRGSGVIDMTTKNGNAVRPSFNVKLNSIDVKALAEVPIGKKWSVLVGGRRSITDVLQTPLYEDLFKIASESNDQIRFLDIGMLANVQGKPSYYFYDTNGKVTYRPSNRDILSISYYSSRDEMEMTDSASYYTEIDEVLSAYDNEFMRWGNYGASLRWGRQWTDKYYTNVRVSNSRFFRRYDYSQAIVLDSMSSTYDLLLANDITDLTFAAENEWRFSDNYSFNFGYSGIRQTTMNEGEDQYVFVGNIDGEFPGDVSLYETEESWLHSGYASVNARVFDKLTLSGGTRINYYFNTEGGFYLEPRISTIYTLTDHLNLKGAYGRSNQFVNQLIVYQRNGSLSGMNENVWVLANEDNGYPVVNTDQVTLGATFKSNAFVYDGELFYKSINDMIISDEFTPGSMKAYGMDLMVQKTTGIHKGWIAYSLSRFTQSHPLILNGEEVPSWQDQRHELKVVDMVTIGNWNLSSTVIYGSGKPYPKYIVQYDRDENGNINAYDVRLDYSNTSRLPQYFRWDLAATYKIRMKDKVQFELGVSFHNITDHKNIKTRRVDESSFSDAIITNTEVVPEYVDVVLLGFTPNLFLSISF